VPVWAEIEGIWKEHDTIEEQKDEGEVSDLPREGLWRNAAFTARPYQGMRHVRLGQYTKHN
jgi:hypothetical protein